ncbi:MAG: VWA domain-containing protein [Deltaproteobacteria bacterium]|nr:VWA domain-containing protein [Deltaproteobacteria bacterium]
MALAPSPPAGSTTLEAAWQSRWEEALSIWSRFTKLAEPRWCRTAREEAAEQLTGSFAMIRLTDHAVVISLRQVIEYKVEPFPMEILAHEIGHHVYAPGDLRDNARLIVRIRAGLPTQEQKAGYVANLYTDLLINDRLQRQAGLDMAGVFKKLKTPTTSQVWTLYMRIYEVLWSLPAGTLVDGQVESRIRSDAGLGARVVRHYAKDWLDGAGRFAALFLPYLIAEQENIYQTLSAPWLDTQNAGAGEEIPDGLAGIEDNEKNGAIHPSEDPELSGVDRMDENDSSRPQAGRREEIGGRREQYRSPQEYSEIMKSLGVKIPEKELVARYYRERAVPHLIRFPAKIVPEATDPLPEGLENWETGAPLADLDWTESLIRSPKVILGVTTVQRTYGADAGSQPERRPVDLYLGVDCSGSMSNPAYNLSYPVLAGTIICLSALRAGAKVMVTLSGEPGEYNSTPGFIRDEKEILNVLTGYLGTGYSFGIARLKATFLKGEKLQRPVHILIVTDSDIFSMLKETKNGWEIAGQALEISGGGGTFVLNISLGYWEKEIESLKAIGWNVHQVTGWEEMIAFARAFAKMQYDRTGSDLRSKG